ncbi:MULTISPECIES: CinA family protein [Acinetobacter]|uniref:CinA family protein n=1 Tax=Acinetobacter indicus TaxID=756892 RepID=A0A7S6VMP3_9GAMM|nr:MULTISPECIES: CinA family protein [Acinetobacter]QFS17305.1 CinA family protein [Acinetobacter indicus]QIC73544.1 CinA family protein [Acinetobacter indicus]QIC76025.1 CinA family protein [Acinetobacter indicus]QIC78904.1 CinA family protein [Acinetobacter indicus]QOW41523.1 CinA family protein [Acinetobacter indicus]
MLKRCCDALEQQQLTIAFIESASSGYLCSQFSIYKNSGADILLGALVSYDPSIKANLLQIDPALIAHYTAESAEITTQMALHGQALFKQANIVVACTGLLKPGGSACAEKPEGTFYIAIHYQQQLHNFHYLLDGSPIERLDQLTQLVAQEVLALILSSPA